MNTELSDSGDCFIFIITRNIHHYDFGVVYSYHLFLLNKWLNGIVLHVLHIVFIHTSIFNIHTLSSYTVEEWILASSFLLFSLVPLNLFQIRKRIIMLEIHISIYRYPFEYSHYFLWSSVRTTVCWIISFLIVIAILISLSAIYFEESLHIQIMMNCKMDDTQSNRSVKWLTLFLCLFYSYSLSLIRNNIRFLISFYLYTQCEIMYFLCGILGDSI